MISLDKVIDQLLYDPKNPLLFNSGFFLYFLFAFMLIYYAVRHNHKARTFVFTVFSLYFFYKACGIYVLMIIVAAVVDYFLSNRIYRQQHQRNKRLLLYLSIILNLGVLFYFKYTDFFIAILNDLSFTNISPLNLLLPIGISFYTFENLSYTVDVYRGEIKPVKSFMDYLFFLSFFPKLMMGPIVRGADFIPQIHQPFKVVNEDFARGFYLIVAGLFKKIVISDYINVNFVAYIFDDPSRHTGIECLFGVYAYAMVIYCDFSGYSDMAIGLAQWLGFKIPDNFRSPYQSASITEFWRRWHISLSSWLKDYLYIPLGGNRKGKVRTYINLFITMVLGGFWHGASWNFLIWGALHGSMLAIDKLKNTLFGESKATGIGKVLGILFTFHFVCFCWIFFRAETLSDSLTIIRQIFTNFNGDVFLPFVSSYANVFALMALGYLTHFIPDGWNNKIVVQTKEWHLAYYTIVFLLFIFLCIQVKTAEQVMPVYLQF